MGISKYHPLLYIYFHCVAENILSTHVSTVNVLLRPSSQRDRLRDPTAIEQR